MSFPKLFFGYGVGICGGGLLSIIVLGALVRDILYALLCRYRSSSFACLATSWTDELIQMFPYVVIICIVAGVVMGFLMWRAFGNRIGGLR